MEGLPYTSLFSTFPIPQSELISSSYLFTDKSTLKAPKIEKLDTKKTQIAEDSKKSIESSNILTYKIKEIEGKIEIYEEKISYYSEILEKMNKESNLLRIKLSQSTNDIEKYRKVVQDLGLKLDQAVEDNKAMYSQLLDYKKQQNQFVENFYIENDAKTRDLQSRLSVLQDRYNRTLSKKLENSSKVKLSKKDILLKSPDRSLTGIYLKKSTDWALHHTEAYKRSQKNLFYTKILLLVLLIILLFI
jgi:chromosome segregation ATPase